MSILSYLLLASLIVLRPQVKGNPVYRYVQETLRSSALDNLAFVDKKAVLAVLDQLHLQSDQGAKKSLVETTALDWQLTQLLSFVALQKRFNPRFA